MHFFASIPGGLQKVLKVSSATVKLKQVFNYLKMILKYAAEEAESLHAIKLNFFVLKMQYLVAINFEGGTFFSSSPPSAKSFPFVCLEF